MTNLLHEKLFSVQLSKLSVKYALNKELRKLFKIQNCNSIFLESQHSSAVRFHLHDYILNLSFIVIFQYQRVYADVLGVY